MRSATKRAASVLARIIISEMMVRAGVSVLTKGDVDFSVVVHMDVDVGKGQQQGSGGESPVTQLFAQPLQNH